MAWMPANRKKYRSIRQLLMFPGEGRGWPWSQGRVPPGSSLTTGRWVGAEAPKACGCPWRLQWCL